MTNHCNDRACPLWDPGWKYNILSFYCTVIHLEIFLFIKNSYFRNLHENNFNKKLQNHMQIFNTKKSLTKLTKG